MAASTNREIIVVADGKAIAETAAQRLIKRLKDAKDRAAICLTGGSSPEGVYRLLAEEPWLSQVPWDRVHWFMGDDRFVPENDPLSNMGMARRLFVDKVRAPRSRPMPMIWKLRQIYIRIRSGNFTAPINPIRRGHYSIWC
jgi:6-phosphogluconolactonase